MVVQVSAYINYIVLVCLAFHLFRLVFYLQMQTLNHILLACAVLLKRILGLNTALDIFVRSTKLVHAFLKSMLLYEGAFGSLHTVRTAPLHAESFIFVVFGSLHAALSLHP